MIRYRYTHSVTEGTTGYFTCEPEPALSLKESLVYLKEHPYDDFMRRHILTHIAEWDANRIAQEVRKAFGSKDIAELPEAVQALIHELAAVRPALAAELPEFFIQGEYTPEAPATSLIFVRWNELPDKQLHTAWCGFFNANIHNHRILKKPEETGLPPPLFDDERLAAIRATADGEALPLPGQHPVFLLPFPKSIAQVHGEYTAAAKGREPYQRPPSDATAALAEQRLTQADIIAGPEMRHTASLSPIALLRPWHVRLKVRQKRHIYDLEGTATTYGRGLSVADARASCLMEMVERASVYLSVIDGHVSDRLAECPVVHGPRSLVMEQTGKDALDPNMYPVEVAYRNEPLHWIEGTSSSGAPVLVPLQMVSLFSNLDEISLYDSPGSTGIATGCTMEEAKLAALLEIAERDAEATTPFVKSGCFTLQADTTADPVIKRLLDSYLGLGINVQFQDITGPLGIPVFKCFVMSMKGTISAGHGAGLSGRRAVISALTETPFPYPDGGPSGPALRKLPARLLHELPDYSLGNPAAELAMLEELLTSNGRQPVYVTLTRKDLAFPVVRALVPGMELAADRDTFSRIPVRLYENYLSSISATPG